MSCILVFDIGTTSLKSAVYDASGCELGSVSVPYETQYPAPGMAEQNPENFWDAAAEGTRILASGDMLHGDKIDCIGLTGHMNGCLAVDAEGVPVYPELIHSDSRSTAECAEILSVLPHEEVYQRTGNRVDEHLSLAKILWMKNNLTEAFRRTAYFMNSKDYLRFRLTGVLGETDYSDGSLTGAMNIAKRQWDCGLITELGLPLETFPRLRRSTDISGGLSSKAAGLLGLTQGIPVAVGGGDAACATRGAGVTDSTRAYASLGSSAWVSTLADHPVFDPAMRMQNFYDLDGVTCNVCGTVQSAGIAIDWILSTMTGKEKLSPDEYRRIENSLLQLPPGSDGIIFLPYLMGERTPHWDAQARGAFVGCSLYHGREAIIRSVYEGVAFALKDIMGIYEELTIPISHFTLLGGGVRSIVWRTILCDVIGIPMELHGTPAHAASMGAAMAAGVSVGLWDSLDQAAEMVQKGGILIPNETCKEAYQAVYRTYTGMYPHLKPIYGQLAELRKQIKEK